ncbi:hypothetical protein FOZ62_002070, partial [Perkinsus olseni]
HLTRALDKVKSSSSSPPRLQLLHESYSVYAHPMKTPPKGQLVLDYLSEAYGVDRSFLQDPSLNASLAAAQDLGLNLSWQRRVTDSSLAHRAVVQQQASLSVEEMLSLLTKIYHSYFEEARDIGDAQVLQDILPSTLSTAGAVPWRTAVEGVPLIEFRQQGATVAQLSGEDVVSDRIYETINRIVSSDPSGSTMPAE